MIKNTQNSQYPDPRSQYRVHISLQAKQINKQTLQTNPTTQTKKKKQSVKDPIKPTTHKHQSPPTKNTNLFKDNPIPHNSFDFIENPSQQNTQQDQ